MLEKYKLNENEIDEVVKSMVILVDTREKKNDHILKTFKHYNVNYTKQALRWGDYSFYIPANPDLGITRDLYFTKDCVLERKKNIDELAQNFLKYRENFERELQFMPEHKVVMIENNSYADLANHNYESNYHAITFLRSFHRMWHRYKCPFFFVPEREAPLFIKHFFEGYIRELFR